MLDYNHLNLLTITESCYMQATMKFLIRIHPFIRMTCELRARYIRRLYHSTSASLPLLLHLLRNQLPLNQLTCNTNKLQCETQSVTC